ncbi:hypothetical protein [Vibrio phage BUCT006]|nr:hypothetical protein [Vibrio phage BUCT006]
MPPPLPVMPVKMTIALKSMTYECQLIQPLPICLKSITYEIW